MKIAIPVQGEILDQHFGHCERFAFFDIAPDAPRVASTTELAAPEHEHGLLPKWLKERGVTHVIAGGMGAHAHSLLQEAAIEVLTGAPSETPASLVQRYLEGNLQSAERTCGHVCNH